MALKKSEVARVEQEQRDEINIIRDAALKEIKELLTDKETSARLVDDKRAQLIAKGTILNAECAAAAAEDKEVIRADAGRTRHRERRAVAH